MKGPILSDLALRSKAVWGYDDDFLEACRKELTITSDYIQSSEVFVIEPEDTILGFYAFYGEVPDARLDFLYVHPDCIGRGLGMMLLGACGRSCQKSWLPPVHYRRRSACRAILPSDGSGTNR